MKSEPDAYGIEDLKKDRRTPWEGVRNYQARNMMRDDMRKGDEAFFYHSNCAEPGIVGLMRVVREAYPDDTQFDRHSRYYDAKSTRENPRWVMVDVRFRRKLKRTITLRELKAHTDLGEFPLVRRGNRLSIMPVTEEQWELILSLE